MTGVEEWAKTPLNHGENASLRLRVAEPWTPNWPDTHPNWPRW